MTVGEAARRLQVDASVIQRRCREGVLKAKVVPQVIGGVTYRVWSIDAADLRAFQRLVGKVGVRAALAKRRQAKQASGDR